MWYDLPPSEYAKSLRYGAKRCEEQAKRHAAESKPWSAHEAARSLHAARRLQAMAMLCDKSTADAAGDVDFLGMNDASQPEAEEAHAIALAEAVSP